MGAALLLHHTPVRQLRRQPRRRLRVRLTRVTRMTRVTRINRMNRITEKVTRSAGDTKPAGRRRSLGLGHSEAESLGRCPRGALSASRAPAGFEATQGRRGLPGAGRSAGPKGFEAVSLGGSSGQPRRLQGLDEGRVGRRGQGLGGGQVGAGARKSGLGVGTRAGATGVLLHASLPHPTLEAQTSRHGPHAGLGCPPPSRPQRLTAPARRKVEAAGRLTCRGHN